MRSCRTAHVGIGAHRLLPFQHFITLGGEVAQQIGCGFHVVAGIMAADAFYAECVEEESEAVAPQLRSSSLANQQGVDGLCVVAEQSRHGAGRTPRVVVSSIAVSNPMLWPAT